MLDIRKVFGRRLADSRLHGRIDDPGRDRIRAQPKLRFFDRDDLCQPLDSGFGPFALNRLTYETNGLYFKIHPNIDVRRPLSKNQTSHLSAYIKYFFDSDVMNRYRPDYVSFGLYQRSLRENRAKRALVEAAEESWIDPIEK